LFIAIHSSVLMNADRDEPIGAESSMHALNTSGRHAKVESGAGLGLGRVSIAHLPFEGAWFDRVDGYS